MPPRDETVDLIVELLREYGPVMASSEDAEFFRKAKYKPQKLKVETKIEIPVPPKVAEPPPLKEIVAAKEAVKEPRPSFDLLSVKNILSVVAPELMILNETPSDETARKIAERWKTKNQSAPISILVYQEQPEQRAFLEEIATALDVYFGPAKIVQAEGIEKEKQWGAFLSVAGLKAVVVCDYTLWQLGALMQFYKETPAQGIRVLGNVPIFLLPDLSLYLKDPSLKRSLWRALCQKFS
ncbi:MAG: hypothetical protein WCF19_00285 [Chlamydiales bacterium]